MPHDPHTWRGGEPGSRLPDPTGPRVANSSPRRALLCGGRSVCSGESVHTIVNKKGPLRRPACRGVQLTSDSWFFAIIAKNIIKKPDVTLDVEASDTLKLNLIVLLHVKENFCKLGHIFAKLVLCDFRDCSSLKSVRRQEVMVVDRDTMVSAKTVAARV